MLTWKPDVYQQKKNILEWKASLLMQEGSYMPLIRERLKHKESQSHDKQVGWKRRRKLQLTHLQRHGQWAHEKTLTITNHQKTQIKINTIRDYFCLQEGPTDEWQQECQLIDEGSAPILEGDTCLVSGKRHHLHRKGQVWEEVQQTLSR